MHGHGGNWTGCANSTKGLIEKDLTLKISKYLEQELSRYYNVKIIQTHNGVNFPKNDPGDLAARAMVARNNNADLYASLHINDNSNTNINGASVYVTSRTELPKYKKEMTRLGNIILNKLNALGIAKEAVYNNKLCNDRVPKYQYYDGSQADYYGDIRHAMKGDTLDGLGDDFRDGSGIPTVLIEHCYMNNSHDVQFLDSEEDLKRLAKADADAIVEYFNLRLKGEVVTELSTNTTNVNLILGEKTKITANVGPTTAKNKALKWISQNDKIAKVDANGNIEATGVGKTNIIVSSIDNPNITKTISINVEEYKVEFAKESYNLLVGKEKTLDVTITPSWIQNKTIIWESSDSSIVEVSNQGKITTKEEGTATIKVTWKEKNLSDEIKINTIKLAEDTKIEIQKYKLENNYISKIGEKEKINDFISNIKVTNNLLIEIDKTSDKQEFIGTNTKVKIKEKSYNIVIEEYNCLIYGDINGDGKITAMDYTLIKNHIMDVKKITDKNMILTADVSGDNKISSMDYTLIKNHIMDVKKITLK